VGERTVERLEASSQWSAWPSVPTANGRRVELTLAPGGFALLRLGGGCDALQSGGCRAALAASPEPAAGSVRLAAQRVSGRSTLTLMDASGRRVWTRALEGETPVVTWDGRGDDGSRARPGIYWARLEDARGAAVRRFTWLGRP